MPELVAHRGDAARHPENTLAAQRAALDAGVRWVECDVQLAADGVPVVLHDADLARTAGDPRAVFDLTADELARFDVPTLADSVGLVATYGGATLFVEVKEESIDRYGLDRVMDAVYRAIAPARDRCVVISFDDAAVAHATAAGFRAGWVLPRWDDDARAVATTLAPEFLFTNMKRVPADAAPWPGPWRWVAYDARTADEALAIAASGFDLVETKDVGGLMRDARVAAWSGGATATDCDVLVVGAGIHGAGVAQAAAAAGHSVVVVERTAPAAGTSGKSSKLIHGGLRYLETAQLSLVYESLAERRRLLCVAPSLVRRVHMHIPVYDGMRRSAWSIRAGLTAYALLGGLDRDARFRALPRREWGTLDGLDTRGLQAVYRYHEAQTDDAALTRAVLDSAVALGARLLMPAELVHAAPDDDGIAATVRVGGHDVVMRARVLVNAAGPWAPAVARRVAGTRPPPAVDLVQGTHLEFDGALGAGAYYVEAPADARAVFVLPYHGRTLVGTTERLHDGDPDAAAPTAEEAGYLIDTYRRRFPGRSVEPVASWAGLRVLPAAATTAFDRPRETVLDRPHPRVLGIYGGKLTTWRPTAARVMERLGQVLPATRPVVDPDGLRLG